MTFDNIKKTFGNIEYDLIIDDGLHSIGANFNTLLLNYPHYHSDQEQLEINNSIINNSHLFSNQISIHHINKNIININLDDIRNNPKYSFLLHMSRENILNSNMLIGRIIRQSLTN